MTTKTKLKTYNEISKTIDYEDIWLTLSSRLTCERKEKMTQVSSQRTNHLCLIIQDVCNEHNISAVLRSAEAFGIQNIHVVSETHNYRPSSVAKGSASWLSVHRHESIASCAKAVHEKGYKICAAVPRPEAKSYDTISVEEPLALLFGNEHAGVSSKWESYVDIYFTLPMVGFVESLNISVCAALLIHHFVLKSQAELEPSKYHLTQKEQNQLLGSWICRKIPTWKQEYAHHKKKFIAKAI